MNEAVDRLELEDFEFFNYSYYKMATNILGIGASKDEIHEMVLKISKREGDLLDDF